MLDENLLKVCFCVQSLRQVLKNVFVRNSTLTKQNIGIPYTVYTDNTNGFFYQEKVVVGIKNLTSKLN
jgi:hypothetical protein